MPGIGALSQYALAQFPGVSTPPTPPLPPARPTIGVNIFPVDIIEPLGVVRMIPKARALVNDPATILLPIYTDDSQNEAAYTLYFQRPDGSRYTVTTISYAYIAPVLNQLYLIYQTDTNELNQRGQWQVRYSDGVRFSQQFYFQIA